MTALGIDAKAEFENLDNFDGLKEGNILGELGILFPRVDVAAEQEKLRQIANA